MPTRHSGPERERLALDVFIKLNRACVSVARVVHAPLREFGLTDIQFGVLDAIAHHGPLPISTIAEKNLCSQNSMCSVLDTMERKGLVRRVRSSEDRRVIHIEMTEAGGESYRAAWPAHLERIVESVGVLSSDEQRTLDELLRKLGKGG